MNVGLLFAAALIFLYGLFPAKPPPCRGEPLASGDFLTVRGTKIVNRAGRRVYLRGTNAGGWLVHEEWMCPTAAPDQKTIRDTLEARFGAALRDELIGVYRDAYWTEQDFTRCAEIGMTCLRLPFIYWDVADEDGNILPDGFRRLDWFVDNCAKRGMYVILDLHGAYGSQNGKHHSGQVNDGRQLYFNEENRARTVRLWEQIARHYAGNPAVAAYDLLNEPERDAGFTDKVQWDFYDELYRAVRAVDPGHIIALEACWWPSSLPNPRVYGWKNVMYQYHHYAWGAQGAGDVIAHSKGEILGIWRAFHGVPVLIGEFTDFHYPEAWDYTLGAYNAMGYHWTTWTYKVTGSGGATWGLYNHNPPKVNVAADSEAEIREKWAMAGTEHGTETFVRGVVEDKLK